MNKNMNQYYLITIMIYLYKDIKMIIIYEFN